MNETLPFLQSIICSCVKDMMESMGDCWIVEAYGVFQFKGGSITVPDMEAYHVRCFCGQDRPNKTLKETTLC